MHCHTNASIGLFHKLWPNVEFVFVTNITHTVPTLKYLRNISHVVSFINCLMASFLFILCLIIFWLFTWPDSSFWFFWSCHILLGRPEEDMPDYFTIHFCVSLQSFFIICSTCPNHSILVYCERSNDMIWVSIL